MSDVPSSRMSSDDDDWTIDPNMRSTDATDDDALDDEAGWLDDIVPDVGPLDDRADRPPILRQVDPGSPIVMVETAFLASTAALIWYINSYFPIGPVLQVFFPIPISLLYLRWGKRAAWMGALIGTLLLTILVGPTRSIQFIVPYGFLGVLLGMLWYRRASWSMAIFLGTILATFGTFFRLWLLSLLSGRDLWLYSTMQVTGFLDWVFYNLGILQSPSLQLVQFFAVVTFVLRNLVYMFVVHVVSWFLYERLGNSISRPPRWVRVLFDME